MNQHKSSCQANPKPNVSVWEMQPDSFLGEVGLQQTSPWICDPALRSCPEIWDRRLCEGSEKPTLGINSCPSIKQLHLPVSHQARSPEQQEFGFGCRCWHWGQHNSWSVPGCSIATILVSQRGVVARTRLYHFHWRAQGCSSASRPVLKRGNGFGEPQNGSVTWGIPK